MDPLINVLPELHDFIFLHFNTRHFKELTSVSPNWNKTIGKSRVMMKKVKLALSYMFDAFKDLKKITSTNRRYQNLELTGRTSHFGGSWATGLQLRFCYKIWKCVASLSTTLLELEMRYFYYPPPENDKILEAIDLSLLKVLKLEDVTVALTRKLLNRCVCLTKLRLKCLVPDGTLSRPQEPISLRPFFEQNEKLEYLETNAIEDFNAFFKEDISEIARFRLKVLKLIETTMVVAEVNEQNLVKFLATQSQSLETLQISFGGSAVIEHIFNEMPALKSCIFWNFPEVRRPLQLNRNEKIVNLKIQHFNIFEDITRAVPNLKKLCTPQLTKEKVEVIARNLPGLEALQFYSCSIMEDGQPVWTALWPHANQKTIRNTRSCYPVTEVRPIER